MDEFLEMDYEDRFVTDTDLDPEDGWCHWHGQPWDDCTGCEEEL